MRIGQLADRLGVNPKTIRFYESIGLIPEPARTPAGYRIYEESDVDRVAFVKRAQRLGIALDEIGEILSLRDRGERPCAYVRDLIHREMRDIDERIAELATLRDELAALDALADDLPGSDAGVCQLIDHVPRPD